MAFFSPKTDRRLFYCSCGRDACDAPQPKPELVQRLELMRALYGGPIRVTSGVRCRWYNDRPKDQGGAGGEPNSEHPLGEGTDLSCVTSRERWQMLEAAKQAGFRRLGIGRDFLHVGISADLGTDVLWTYYPKPKP